MHSAKPAGGWRLLKIVPGALPGDQPPAAPGPAVSSGSVAALLAAADSFTHVLLEPASGAADPALGSLLVAAAERHPDAVIIGCQDHAQTRLAMMERMCLRLEAGVDVADPHSPYRVFPLAPLRRLPARRQGISLWDNRLLAHLAWGGVPLHTLALPGPGAPANKPRGAARTLLGHAGLLLRRLAPWPHPRLVDQPPEKMPDFWHPLRLLRQVLAEHATPRDLAVAGFVGVFLGALPLIACHTVVILYVTTRFRLNRGMAVAAQNLCAPPVVPVACVEVGYFLRHGGWLTELSRQTLLREIHQRLLDWFLGSLIVGPLLGLVTAFAILVSARAVARWSSRRKAQTRINDRRRGNRPGFLSFAVALRLFGRRGAHGLLSVVALYYLLFDPLARRLARPYLGRRFPDHAGWRRWADLYRLIFSQGVSLIDRYRMLATPQVFRQLTARYELVRPLVEDRARGFVLLVSHVGNWQALMLALARMDRNITLLMKPEENPITQDYLRFQGGAQALRVVSPELPMGGVIELTQRFEQGDLIAIMGDRAYAAATLEINFMGAPARFPCGPFQLAAAWECPLVVMFAARTGVDEYTADMVDIIRVARGGDRRANLRRAMQAYADRLQEFAQRYPYQVYLFEDVWR